MRCQIERGGYSGNDIAKLAKNIPVSSHALRKRINYWTSTDPAFNQLTYQGQRTISITLDDFILIDQQLNDKPLGRMSDILRVINDNRQEQGKEPIPSSSFYRFVNSQKESLFTYTDLKTFGGIDIDSIASRLQEAQKWFQRTHPGADPFEWFSS